MSQRPTVSYEKRLYKEGYTAIAGVDEVGRGAWAGPIVACALIIPIKPRIKGVNDSKQLMIKKRKELAERIRERAVSIGIGTVAHYEIDQYGIGLANKMAMRRAVEALDITPDFVLIDAFCLAALPMKQAAVVNGDNIVYSIAAASIMAKVTRDEVMMKYHTLYPQYSFHTNKGYGTQEHNAALALHGMTEIHRRSFQPMNTMVY